MNIVVANRQRARKINARLLKEIAEALLADLKIEKVELGINLVGEREMTLLNETFLKHEGSTDVITFDHAEKAAQASRLHKKSLKREIRRRDACAALCGEICICLNEAVSQAKQFDTSWQSEIVRYIVHGVLHLLGFDDSSAGARHKMKREENRRLGELSRRFTLAQLSRPARIPA